MPTWRGMCSMTTAVSKRPSPSRAGTVVPAGGYLVMVAKEEGSFDFGLGKKGDALTLLDASGAVTDEVEIPALDDDETYGRRTDGAAEWTVFGTSTRGASNAGGTVRE